MTTGFIQAFRTACACVLAAVAFAPATASAATFPATPSSLGAIPDATEGVDCGPAAAGPARDVQFTVSGLSASAPSSVGVSMTFSPTHSFAGDLDVVLLAPDGATGTTIFARIGSFGLGQCGTPATAMGPYTFADGAHDSPSFWDAAVSSPIPAGAYRASVAGGTGAAGDNALITPAFASVTNPNGVWTLRFRDEGATDTGSVSAASLSLNDPDTIAPLAPTLLSTQPDSPANFNTPTISGIAEAGSQVSFYPNATCSGTRSGFATAALLADGIKQPVADNTTTVYAVTATDAAGNTSPCSNALTYVEDSASSAPVLTTEPPSPSKDNTPRLRGAVEAGSQVKIFKNGACTGNAFATRTAAAFTATGLIVSVTPNATNGLSAIATDPIGNVSPCGAYVYVEDSTRPQAPILSATTPSSPANVNQVRLRGSAEAGSTVNVYARGACAGSPVAHAAAADLTAGIPVTVADNTTSSFGLVATDAAGNTSPCSLRRTYVEDSRAPTTSITRAPSTTRTRRASARVSFSFRSNEGGAHFTCRIGAAAFRACRSPATFTLRRGRRTFSVVAIDAAGNRDKTPARRTVRVVRRR